MKISESQLIKIVKEELSKVNEGMHDDEIYDKVSLAIDKIRDLVEEADYATRNSPAAKNELVDFIDSLYDTYGSGDRF